MTFWEVVVLITLIVTVICAMYYCYFQKMKRIERSLGFSYEDQGQRCYSRDQTRSHDGEIFTITANGLVLREVRLADSSYPSVRRSSKEFDLPPTYEEAVRNCCSAENSRTNSQSPNPHP